jgi:hypothetical protein
MADCYIARPCQEGGRREKERVRGEGAKTQRFDGVK